mmetsp:Transcript_27886/g.85108  ORF Transcript_27886/g.85108 Transcript_27886/m.85108 type:complete len:159 (-) Transcript_27886:61-537(-)
MGPITYGEGLEVARREHARLAELEEGKKARAAQRQATEEQRTLGRKVAARAAAAKLWSMDGAASRLKKNELMDLLNEVGAGGGPFKPLDGKKEKLLPAFQAHVQKAGCWEAIVIVLWDPPADELDAQGRKRAPPQAPAAACVTCAGVGGALDGNGTQS